MSQPTGTTLQRSLGPVMLWGLGVGYVISGEYFGWNLGLPLGGTYGMLVATLLVTLMYVAFIFSYIELACAIPRAGGAFVYSARAMGPGVGFVAGMAQWVEFVFAPPAIAMAIAAYINQRLPGVPTEVLAVGAYLCFTYLNTRGVKIAATFELVITILAVLELLIFMGVAFPAVDFQNFHIDPLPRGWSGVFECLPFAIWFYLAIEGVANAAEEAKNPQRNIPIGFGAAMLTLVFLALGVFFTATSVGGWKAIVYPAGETTPSDAPLPLALAQVVGDQSWLYTLLLGVGVLGLVASFHGIILAAARATFEFGRSGYAPSALAQIEPSRQTPNTALWFNMAVGVVAILSGQTGDIITLSCFGAVTLYAISMVALFRLRQTEPDLARPFKALLYPIAPAIALVLALVCLASLAWFNTRIGGLYLLVMLVAGLYYRAWVMNKIDPDWAKN